MSTRLVQLSDLHLSGKVGEDNSYQRCVQVMAHALAMRPDFLLLTGDLVNEGRDDGYEWLFALLNKQKIPHMCLAGNHDVSIEQGHFSLLSPTSCHPILKHPKIHQLGAWQLIGLNSAVAGCIHGHLSKETLAFVAQHLNTNKQSTLIALHHHPTPVGSAWIDAYRLDNADALQRILSTVDYPIALVCGHVHQAHRLSFAGSPLYTCPAVARQFLPFADDFRLDCQQAGFRVFELGAKGLTTTVHRLKK